MKNVFFSTKQISQKYSYAVRGWKRLCVMMALLCVCCAAWGQMRDSDWACVGGSGAGSGSGNWSTSSNWSGNVIPNSIYDRISFPKGGITVTLSENIVLSTLSVPTGTTDAVTIDLNGHTLSIVTDSGDDYAGKMFVGDWANGTSKASRLIVKNGTLNVATLDSSDTGDCNLKLEGVKMFVTKAYDAGSGFSVAGDAESKVTIASGVTNATALETLVQTASIPVVNMGTSKIYVWVGGVGDSLDWNKKDNWNIDGGGTVDRVPGPADTAKFYHSETGSYKFTDHYNGDISVNIIDLYRPVGAGNGVTKDYIFDVKVTATTLTLHSGVNVFLNGSGEIGVIGSIYDANNSISLEINGDVNNSTSIDLKPNTTLAVGSSGKFTVKTLTCSSEGTVYSTNPIKNNGSIIGGVVAISAPYITGSGDISVSSGTITLSSTSNASTIKNLAIGTGGTFIAQKDVTISEKLTNTNSNPESIFVSGNLTVGGATETASPIVTTGNQTYTGDFTLTGTDNRTLQVGGTTLSFGGTFTGNNGDVTIGGSDDSGKTVTFGGAVSGVGNLTSNYATTLKNATITTSGNQSYNGNVVLETNSTLASSATATSNSINLARGVTGSGALTITGTTATGQATTFTPGGDVAVNLNIAGNVAISSTLNVSGSVTNSGAIAGSGAITVTGDFTNASGATFGGSGNLSLKGNLTDSGTWNNTGEITFNGSSTQIFKNNSDKEYLTVNVKNNVSVVKTDGSTANDFKVSNITVDAGKTLSAAAITVGASATIDGTGAINAVSLTNGGSFTANSGTITLTGDLKNTGTFNAGTGTVKLIGAGSSAISGVLEFYNLTIENNSDTDTKNVEFPAGETNKIKVTNAFAVTGNNLSAGGKNIVLSSSSPGMTQTTNWWYLASGGTVTITNAEIGYAYSDSVRTISDSCKETISPTNEYTTSNWFSTHKYYWFAKSAANGKWNTSGNWCIDEDGKKVMGTAPAKNDGSAVIVVKDSNLSASPPCVLTLEEDVTNVKSITIESGKMIDLATFSIKTTDGMTSNGTLRLVGDTSQTITGGFIESDGSTIEYYCAFKNLLTVGSVTKTTYKNLSFDTNSGSSALSNDIVVSENLTIKGTLNAGTQNIACTGDFTNASGGTFNAGTGNVTVGGNLKNSRDGTITGDDTNPGAITISGMLDDSAGTWSHKGAINFIGSSVQTFKANSTTEYSTVNIKNDLNILTSDGTRTANLKAKNLTLDSGKTLTAGDVAVSNAISIGGTVITTGNQSYTGAVTLTGDATFIAKNSSNVLQTILFTNGFSDAGTTGRKITVTGNTEIGGDTTYNEIAITGETKITGSNTFNEITITGSSQFAGNNTFTNITIDNSGIDASTTASFAAGKTQTIGTCLFKGKSTEKPLRLKSFDAATPSNPSLDNWKVCFTANPTVDVTTPTNSSFNYVVVERSSSVDNGGAAKGLELKQSASTVCEAIDSGVGTSTNDSWFDYDYTWNGSSDSKWTTVENWKYSDGTDAFSYPLFGGSVAKITIDTADGKNDLELGAGVGDSSMTEINIAEIKINSGKRIDIGKCKIIVTSGITNNGAVCLDGSQEIPLSVTPGSITHGDESTVEFEGWTSGSAINTTYAGLGLTTEFKNLKVTGSGEFKFTDSTSLTVGKSFSTNSSKIITSGNQTYKGAVSLKNASSTTLDAGGTSNEITLVGVNLTSEKDLTIDNATFKAGNGNVTVGGSLATSESGAFGAEMATVTVSENLSNSGTFNAGTGETKVAGILTNTGTFNAESGKISVNGNLSNSGTFNAGTSEIELVGNLANTSTFNSVKETIKIVGTGTSEIIGIKTFNNLIIENESTSNKKIVKFPFGNANEITINGNFTVSGKQLASEENNITLTASGTPTVVQSTWWYLNVAHEKVLVENAEIGYAYSVNKISSLPSKIENCDESLTSNYEYTTYHWFDGHKYFWFGDTSEQWTEGTNWKVKIPNSENYHSLTASGAPICTDETAIIEIVNGTSSVTSPYILKLAENLDVKSITVGSAVIVDFAEKNVKVNDTQVGITNNGKVQLVGGGGANPQTISGKMINGENSAVEYYGNCVQLAWDGDSATDGKQYENLIFTSVTQDVTLSDKIDIAKNLTINQTENIKFDGVISVVGSTTLNSGIEKSVSFTNSSDEFSDEITVSGAIFSIASELTKPLSVIGAGSLLGDLKTRSNLAVSGKMTADSNVIVSGDISNSGIINVDKTVTVEGDISNSRTGKITVGESITLKGNLADEGDMTDVAELVFAGEGGQSFASKPTTVYNKITVEKGNDTAQTLSVLNDLKSSNITITKNHATKFNGDTTIATLVDSVGAGDLLFNGVANKITSIGNAGELLTEGTVTFGETSETSETTISSGLKHTSGKTVAVGTLNVGDNVTLGETKIGGILNVGESSERKSIALGITEIVSDMTTNCADITLNGNVTGNGSQTYNGTVAIGDDITISTPTNKTIKFSSTIDGEHSVSIYSGNTIFGDSIGATAKPVSLSVSGDVEIKSAKIFTSQSQTYSNGIVTVSMESALFDSKAITFNGNVELSASGVIFDSPSIVFNGLLSNNAGGVIFQQSNYDEDYTFIVADNGTETGFISNGGAVKFAGDKDKKLTFKAGVGNKYADVVFTKSGTFDFGNNPFEQGDSDSFIIQNTEVNVGIGKFIAGKLSVSNDGKFIQIGKNTDSSSETDSSVQSVSTLATDDSSRIVWDKDRQGGYLFITGGLIQADSSSNVNFNNKTVVFKRNITLSGTFLDMIIPDGVTVTNENGIDVLRSLEIGGSAKYVHNNQRLTFSEYAENGHIQNFSQTVQNLGHVIIDLTNPAADTKFIKSPVIIDTLEIKSGTLDVTNEKASLIVNGVTTNKDTILGGVGNIDFKGDVLNIGAIIGAEGNLTFDGKYYSSAIATFTASSTETKFAGDVDLTNTSFTHNNGKIIFNGTAAQDFTTNEQVFNNMELNCMEVKASGNIKAVGSLEIVEGKLDFGANSVTIDGKFTNEDTFTGNGAVDVGGDTVNNGTIAVAEKLNLKGNLTDEGAMTDVMEIVFCGTGAMGEGIASQTFVPKSATTYKKITVEKDDVESQTLSVLNDLKASNITITKNHTTLFEKTAEIGSLTVTENDTLTFSANATISTLADAIGAGAITFNGATTSITSIGTAGELLTDGTVSFGGATGTSEIKVTSGLKHTAGKTVIIGTLTVGDDISLSETELGGDTKIICANATFNSTINSAIGMNKSLTVDASGGVTIKDSIGGIQKLSELKILSVGGTETSSKIDIYATENVMFGSQLTLGGDIVIVSDTASGTISFDSEIKSKTSEAHSLGVTASKIIFGGKVGDDKILSSVDVNGDSVLKGGLLSTSETQTYNGKLFIDINDAIFKGSQTASSIVLNGNVESTVNVTFETPVEIKKDLALTAVDKNVSFDAITLSGAIEITCANSIFNSTVNGGHNFVVDSEAQFEKEVGNITPISSIELKNTATINGGIVKTSGNQIYRKSISLSNSDIGTTFTVTDGSSKISLYGNVLSDAGSLDFAGDVYIDVADFELHTANDYVMFEKTIKSNNRNISILTGAGNVTFNGTVGGTENPGDNPNEIKITNSGDIYIYADMTALSDVSFEDGGTVYIGKEDSIGVSLSAKDLTFNKILDVTSAVIVSENITLNKGSNVLNAAFTNSGILYTAPNTSVIVSNRFVQNGSGKIMIGGNFITTDSTLARAGGGNVANEILFAQDVYLYGTPLSVKIGGGDTDIKIAGNLILAYDSEVPVIFDSQITAKNIVLYAGDLKVNKNLSSTEDIVLLGSNYADNDGEEGHGVDEFMYTKRRRKAYSYKGFDSETRDKFPNGNNLPESDSYKGAFTVAPRVSVKVGENFFANGISLVGVSDSANDIWYLDAKQNSDASVCFIEAYVSLIENSVVRCYEKSDGTVINPPCEDYQNEAELLAKGAADDSCNDNGNKNNKNWDLRPFEILRVYTVSDNVVCVELSGELRNHYRELEDNVGYITFNNNGTEEGFAKVYKSYSINGQYEKSGVTIETEDFADGEDISTFYYGADGKKIYYFYLQTKAEVGDKDSSSRWNTDATGKSAGNEKSTDNHGKHQNVIPSIKFSRTLDGHAEAYSFNFTNKWGKILVNSGSVYEDTVDCASPVLTAVYSGQETHNPNIAEQHSYDAHNYLEFVFSEPIDFGEKDNSEIGWLPSYADDGVTPSVAENVRASQKFGAIESTSSTLSVSGLAKIHGGSLSTGVAGVTDNSIHGFYRSNSHKLRLSIAGYTEGVVTDNDGNEYKKWVGYINNATSPGNGSSIELQQDALSFVNDLALDRDGNPAPNNCKLRNYANYKNGEDLKLNYVSSETHLPDNTSGMWDVVKPSFAVYRNVEKPWQKESLKEAEAIGSTIDGTSSLKRLEFHMFDNEPSYSENDNYQWVTKQGWVKSFDAASGVTPELYEEYSYAADVFGGARPFEGNPDDENSSRTSGGIRYCSIVDAYDAFRYVDITAEEKEPNLSFDSSLKAFTGASSPIFQPAKNPSRNPDGSDGLYFGYNLSKTILSLRTQFAISYDSAKGYITDLAGNRLGNGGKIKIKTRELTPPSFNMTIAPVGQNKIYIMFTKILSTDKVMLANESNDEVVKDALTDAYPNAFGLYELVEGNIPSESASIKIDTSVPARILYKNNDYIGIELTLTRDVTFDDLQKLYLVAKPQSEKFKDPIIDISSTFTTFIQDNYGNYMTAYTAHALSDFAVDVINPLYAYDESIGDANDKVQVNLYGEGTNAVHDWDAEQQNFGTLVPNDEIHIISSVKISSSEKEVFKQGDFKARIYLDNNPAPETISEEYNRTASPSENWRIWLPKVTGFSMFTPLAKVSNGNFDVAVDGISGKEYDFDFVIPKDKVSAWVSGDQVSFLFCLHDSSNNPLTVVHTPVYDYSANTYSLSDRFPLFSLRLKNSGDLTSLDLWSFKLKSQTLQRGGVTILNNVINAAKSEKTVVRIDNPASGKVDVVVMTLDGNIVDYLNRGNLDSGTHYFAWNGHNRNKKPVARGMYFIRVIGNGFDETRKVMVVK